MPMVGFGGQSHRRGVLTGTFGAGVVLLALAGIAAFGPYAPEPAPVFETGTIPADHIELPDGAANAVVFLFSDSGGWSAGDQSLAS